MPKKPTAKAAGKVKTPTRSKAQTKAEAAPVTPVKALNMTKAYKKELRELKEIVRAKL